MQKSSGLDCKFSNYGYMILGLIFEASSRPQLLTVIVLILVRTGFPGGTQASFLHTDHLWLSIIAAGGYIIILGVMLATYVLGDAMPDKTVS